MTKGDQFGSRTRDKLTELQFKSATEMKKEQTRIQRAIWARFEEARIINELSSRPEYQFWNKKFNLGLSCSYGSDKTELVKIHTDDNGALEINIHEKNGKDIPSECLLEVLVKAMTESFGGIYFKSMGIIPSFPIGLDIAKKEEETEKKSKPSKNKRSQ